MFGSVVFDYQWCILIVKLFKVFGKECKNFNQLDEWGKFVFMLNSEGKLAAATGKMIHDVISVTRCLPARTRY